MPMSIKESIAKIGPEDPLTMVVDERCMANYVQALAKQNGQKVRARKLETGGWELYFLGKKRYNKRYK